MSNYSQNMKKFLDALTITSILQAGSTQLLAGTAELGEIVVTGTQSEHSSWHSPILTQSLPLEPLAPPQNLADFLRRQSQLELAPGIRGRTLRLQGLEGKYILILRDGQRIGGKVGDSIDLDAIDLSGVERVEITGGASSALYGSDAMGGVINLISRRRAQDPSAPAHSQQIKLSQSSDERTQLSAQGQIRSAASEHLLFIRKNRAAPLAKSGSQATRISGREGLEIGASQDWRISSEFSVIGRIGFEKADLDGTDVTGAGAVWDRSNAIQRYDLALSPRLQITETTELRLQSQLQVYEDRYQTELRLRPEEQKKEHSKETLAQHTLSIQSALGLDHLVTLGFEELSETLDADRLSQAKVRRRRHALFFQDEYSLHERLMLVPGLRLEKDSQFSSQTLGKFAVRYAWSERTILRPSYGQAYRAPSFKELYLRFENPGVGYIVQGSPDLKPERSEQWQLSVDHALSEEQSLSSTIFQNAIRDMIGTVADTSAGTQNYRYQNFAEVRTQGLDSSWSFKGEALHFELGYHFLEAEDRQLRRALEARPRHRLRYRLSQLRLGEKLWLAHEASMAGAQTLYDAEAKPSRTPSTYYAGADLRHQISRTWTGSVAIENLTNAAEDRVLEVRPRSFILGISWNHANLSEEVRP